MITSVFFFVYIVEEGEGHQMKGKKKRKEEEKEKKDRQGGERSITGTRIRSTSTERYLPKYQLEKGTVSMHSG